MVKLRCRVGEGVCGRKGWVGLGGSWKVGRYQPTKVNNLVLCASFAEPIIEKCFIPLVVAVVLTITGIGILIALTLIGYSKWINLAYATHVVNVFIY